MILMRIYLHGWIESLFLILIAYLLGFPVRFSHRHGGKVFLLPFSSVHLPCDAHRRSDAVNVLCFWTRPFLLVRPVKLLRGWIPRLPPSAGHPIPCQIHPKPAFL